MASVSKTGIIKPKALKKADKIGLICPSSRPSSPAAIKRSVRLVEEMGFLPVVGKQVLNTHGYMAGSDDERLEDIHNFIKDDSIAGIFCVTGGYGSLRLLADLDYKSISKHPKVFVGCDDNTSLLLAIFAKTGLITFHGPNLDQLNAKYSYDRLYEAVTNRKTMQSISVQDVNEDSLVADFVFSPFAGNASGKILGGNLTAMLSLLGTPFEPDFTGSILFLEDRDERNDFLDRWFTTLCVSGIIKKSAAITFGEFVNCTAKDQFNLLSLEDLFGDRLMAMKKPSCFGLPLGQGKKSATVPLGALVQFDAANGKIEFLEPALL